MVLYSAFLFGLLGSFHCAGMCGPIALALPVNHRSGIFTLLHLFTYNAGRIFTYAMLGLFVGLIGHRLSMAGFQKSLSISSGLLIVTIALISFFRPRWIFSHSFFAAFTMKIKSLFRNLFGKKSALTLFSIGLVNGLLPCGFVYLALAAALSTGDVFDSSGYMALFGLGTLPMMLAFSYAGNFFGFRFNSIVRKAAPYLAMVVGILLIYRGIGMTGGDCCHR
jgi:sulfite exporter TauE/SafE